MLNSEDRELHNSFCSSGCLLWYCKLLDVKVLENRLKLPSGKGRRNLVTVDIEMECFVETSENLSYGFE